VPPNQSATFEAVDSRENTLPDTRSAMDNPVVTLQSCRSRPPIGGTKRETDGGQISTTCVPYISRSPWTRRRERGDAVNRNFTSVLASILVCLVFGFLTGCGSSSSTPPPPPTIAIMATSGSGQTATVGEAFTNQLIATVTSNGTAAGGVTVTFTPDAGSAGQSCTPSATTVTTASDGTASITY
jgi:hypothetical protein